MESVDMEAKLEALLLDGRDGSMSFEARDTSSGYERLLCVNV